MIAELNHVLQGALNNKSAVAGFVGLGWEDMRAYVQAAEEAQCPLILQAGPGCRANTPLEVLAPMMRQLAGSVSVPVVVHLDHSKSLEECQRALDLGFTGLMFDGSALPLEDNIRQTQAVVELAKRYNVGVEGEIGFVGYAQGLESTMTDPDEAALFAKESGVAAMAISVGNVHLQTEKQTSLDEQRVQAIGSKAHVPLVIHGGSGVPVDQRRQLGKESLICKYNIGTELRQAFAKALRETLDQSPDLFDRIEIMKHVEKRLMLSARDVLTGLQ